MDELKNDNLAGVYKDIADAIGIENTFLLYKSFAGQQITFPTKILDRTYVKDEVSRRYDGSNIRELASQYGYTERSIRKFLSQNEGAGRKRR